MVFRNSSQDDVRLDYLSRLHLLELIELRAKGWRGSDNMNQYYRKKVSQVRDRSRFTSRFRFCFHRSKLPSPPVVSSNPCPRCLLRLCFRRRCSAPVRLSNNRGSSRNPLEYREKITAKMKWSLGMPIPEKVYRCVSVLRRYI